jgi:L-ascorbate metabolism protein UlaG (beta-lactamase superfamily)
LRRFPLFFDFLFPWQAPNVLIGGLGFLFLMTVSPALSFSDQMDKKHHSPSGFKNLQEYRPSSFLDFLKWRWQRRAKDIQPPESYDFPLAKNDPVFLRENSHQTTLTWIGHATVLFQVGGKNILTDPHFSERASPVQWAGPKRAVVPGLALDALPPIDLVVISHDHYDSLDKQSVLKLKNRPGGEKTVFFVPLRLEPWFQKLGVEQVVALDWWESQEYENMNVVAVPVQHWSKRRPFVSNDTLWAGWVVLADNFRFFFCGDTGYAPVFKEIGEKYGPFDLSTIPIGAYEPRWFMRHHHITPEEAVQVHLDVRSKKSVAIHWGTFVLTDEPLDEPPERLKKAVQLQGMPEDAFVVLQHGETIIID